MNRHLSNLDEILEEVRNPYSKEYVREAISAYRSGAYRASLVTIWVAVCVDIVEKIIELSIGGDGSAKKIHDELEKIKPDDFLSMMKFEREILNYACEDLEIISHIEKTHLERLKDDRNICAHPTISSESRQFSPNAELALSYIVQTANYLFLQRPVKGKTVINKTYKLIQEESFPNSDEEAFTILKSDNQLGKVKDSSIRNLCIILLKRLFSDEEKISEVILYKIASALGAISRIHPQTYRETIKEKLSLLLGDATDTRLKRALPFLSRRHDSWNQIDESVRVRIDGLITSMPPKELISYRLANLAEKNERIRRKYLEKIKSIDTDNAISILSSKSSWVHKELAISFFANSKSYDNSEIIGNQILVPLAKHFTNEDLKTTLKSSLENTGMYGRNQILYAGSIDYFFLELYAETKEHVPSYRDAWRAFWEAIDEKGDLLYAQLKAALEKDGIIESTEEEEDIDIPF